jgi:hypothetical protein
MAVRQIGWPVTLLVDQKIDFLTAGKRNLLRR